MVRKSDRECKVGVKLRSLQTNFSLNAEKRVHAGLAR